MDQAPFKQFIDLVSFDQGLIKLFQERRRVAELLADLYDKKNDLLDEHDAVVQQLHDAKKQVDVLELEMRGYSDQEKEIRERFHGITNNKEFQSLKKEADHYKEQQYNLEQELVTAWHVLETVQKKSEALKDQQSQVITALEGQELVLEKQVADIEEQIKQHEHERIMRSSNIPQEWLSQYERMKHSVSNPVVVLDPSGSCSACFSPLGQQDLMMVTERKKLLPCPNCFRLLYTLTMQEGERAA